jgi:hypothetical protein
LSRVATITEAAEFEAPASAVWALLIDWPAIADWMPGGYIRSLECDGQGLGAVRHLVTGQGVHLSERLDAADEDSGIVELSLVGELPWGLLSYAARGTLDELADNRSRLTWRGTLEMNGNGDELDKVCRLLRKSYATMLLGIRQTVEP